MAFTAYKMVGAGLTPALLATFLWKRVTPRADGVDRRRHAGHGPHHLAAGSALGLARGRWGRPVDVTEYMIYPAVDGLDRVPGRRQPADAALPRPSAGSPSSVSEHRDLASELLKAARSAGADAADMIVSEGTEFSVTVRRARSRR